MNHDLYTNKDADRPNSICDSNGSVVLALCKRCGKGEAELDGPCVPRSEGEGEQIELGMKRMQTFVYQVFKVQGIEATVCQDIAQRQQLGIAKYGQTVADNPLSLREWLQHAYEECLDQAVYLKRAMAEVNRELETQPQLVQMHPEGHRPLLTFDDKAALRKEIMAAFSNRIAAMARKVDELTAELKKVKGDAT